MRVQPGHSGKTGAVQGGLLGATVKAVRVAMEIPAGEGGEASTSSSSPAHSLGFHCTLPGAWVKFTKEGPWGAGWGGGGQGEWQGATLHEQVSPGLCAGGPDKILPFYPQHSGPNSGLWKVRGGLCVRACVGVCVCACVRGRVCVGVCACNYIICLTPFTSTGSLPNAVNDTVRKRYKEK